nr:ogr/Delta-like zinc finger family protein [Burkholderia pseudomallei]
MRLSNAGRSRNPVFAVAPGAAAARRRARCAAIGSTARLCRFAHDAPADGGGEVRFTIACPHCGARGIARVLEQKSALAWEIDYQCDDVVCGHTYRARLEMTPSTAVERRAKPGEQMRLLT